MLHNILVYLTFLASAFANPSSTFVDFESVNVNASIIRPSLQIILERRTSTEFDPYEFAELCFESNKVIKGHNNASLRLIEGSGILHEQPLLEPGKYRTCIMNNQAGDRVHTNYTWIVTSDKRKGMRVYDEASPRTYDCEKGIKIDAFGRAKLNTPQEDCKEKNIGKLNDMFFEGLTSFNVTLLYPDIISLDKNVVRNVKNHHVISKYCGSTKEHCQYTLPKLAVVRLSRVKDNKIIYIGFDKESVTIERKHIIFNMNEQSWLFYMEKINE
jgi:hypothetical protein